VIRAMTSHQFQKSSSPVLPPLHKLDPESSPSVPLAFSSASMQARTASFALMGLIPGRPEDDPLFRYLDGELRQRLTTAINDLSERERLVMNLYYYEEMTMREIGLILGVHESRVSQTHASAVLHLRARLSSAVTAEQPRGNENHPNPANRETFRKRANARKPKNRSYAEATGSR
jgi:RNA polymerase sigma factor (sigma-70 family)